MSAGIFHADFSDRNHMIHFIKNISIAGGFLFAIAHSAGTSSMDNREKAEINSCPKTIADEEGLT